MAPRIYIRARSIVWNHVKYFAPVMALFIAGCGTTDLTQSTCLPVHGGDRVELLRGAALYRFDGKLHLLSEKDEGGLKEALPVGTKLQIRKIERKWGLDSGPQEFEVYGKSPSGLSFKYYWGIQNTLHRAPWESMDLPADRSVDCKI